MNQEQADKIKRIISADANATGTLFPAEGESCAIGGLLEYWRPELRQLYGPDEAAIQHPEREDFLDFYGFQTYYEVRRIMMVNDRHKRSKWLRHRDLHKTVQQMVTT